MAWDYAEVLKNAVRLPRPVWYEMAERAKGFARDFADKEGLVGEARENFLVLSAVMAPSFGFDAWVGMGEYEKVQWERFLKYKADRGED